MADSELSKFEKLVADFETKLSQPVTQAEIKMAQGESVPEAPPTVTSEAVPVAAGESCVSSVFKKLIEALSTEFIGTPDVKDTITILMSTIKEC